MKLFSGVWGWDHLSHPWRLSLQAGHCCILHFSHHLFSQIHSFTFWGKRWCMGHVFYCYFLLGLYITSAWLWARLEMGLWGANNFLSYAKVTMVFEHHDLGSLGCPVRPTTTAKCIHPHPGLESLWEDLCSVGAWAVFVLTLSCWGSKYIACKK